MMSVSSSNFADAQMTSLRSILKVANWKDLKEAEKGYIFTDEYLASNWDDIAVRPESLPKGEAKKGMRKVSSPVLLLKSHNSKMAFILATESSPVYVCSSFIRDKVDGYTMLFTIMPQVYPDYFFYMSKYKTWTRISYDLDSLHKYGLESGFSHVGNCIFDGYTEFVIYSEYEFLNGNLEQYIIPSLTVQRQQMDDAKMMELVILDKMSEKERKFQQKEWLNETHIRNCKHRLSNDIMPVRMAVERLERFLANSHDGIKLSSIIGEATQQTVGKLLINLKSSIQNIETEVDNLTKSETVGEQFEILDVELFIREYFEKSASKFSRSFEIDIEVRDEDLKIGISRKSFIELLDNVVLNAVRHGFTDVARDDYRVRISLSKTSDGCCRIDIANNGNPISERGRKEYFVRGSFAGETGHTGIGGARVFEICEEFKGKAIEPYSIEGYPVVVSVELPIVSL